MVAIEDDPEHFFQDSPPLPIDVAVILNNIHRYGVKRLANAAVFSWENPDPISLVALEKTMAGFESLLTAAPLSRGAAPQPMPASFRRASIPLASIQGSPLGLPVVNRVPIPNVILAADNGWSGFSVLDAEENSAAPYLLARWEDRVVFSFPVLAILQSRGLPMEGIRIKSGEYLALSAGGPFLPIDSYGRLLTPLKAQAQQTVIPASALISDTKEIVRPGSPAPVILRDDQSAADVSTRGFSQNLAAALSAVSQPSSILRLSGLHPAWEISLLLLASALMGVTSGLAWSKTRMLVLLIIGVLVDGVIARTTSHWLPLTPFLAAGGSSILLCALLPKLRMTDHKLTEIPQPPKSTEEPVTAKTMERPKPIEPAAPIESAPPAETPKPKTEKSPPPKKAAKKATAKKAPAKKAAAKKSATKAPRGKKPSPPSES